jgi:hypothetical protein
MKVIDCPQCGKRSKVEELDNQGKYRCSCGYISLDFIEVNDDSDWEFYKNIEVDDASIPFEKKPEELPYYASKEEKWEYQSKMESWRASILSTPIANAIIVPVSTLTRFAFHKAHKALNRQLSRFGCLAKIIVINIPVILRVIIEPFGDPEGFHSATVGRWEQLRPYLSRGTGDIGIVGTVVGYIIIYFLFFSEAWGLTVMVVVGAILWVVFQIFSLFF